MTSSVRISNTNKLGGRLNDLSNVGAITCHPQIAIGTGQDNTVINENKLRLSAGGEIVIGTTTINSSSIAINPTNNATATIGKAVIGTLSTDHAKFCHLDYQNSDKYTLKATNNGQTWLNSSYSSTAWGYTQNGNIVFTYKNSVHAVLRNGRFGIGNILASGPQFPLHVNGSNGSIGTIQNTRLWVGAGNTSWNNVNFPNVAAYIKGDFWAEGFIAAVTYISYSDERIKENIVDVNASENLDIFRNIQLKTYNYIDKALRGHESTPCFIAQQIQQI